MADPVLEAHAIHKGVYLLSGPQPISIRDQMLRGFVLVERLLKRPGWDRDKKRLLVVGAGVAGATAAMAAAEANIETFLVDRARQPFLTQYLSPRFVEPVQYDWPLDHWIYRDFPWRPGVKLPLAFRRNTGRGLVIDWQRALAGALTDHAAHFRVGYGQAPRKNDGIRPSGTDAAPLVYVTFESGVTDAYDAVILAAGLGTEDRLVTRDTGEPRYEGSAFWGPETFLRDTLPADPRVVISGSGDGGLQDYLHVMTGMPTVRQLYNACVPADYPQRLAMEGAIQSAEDRAQRGRSWADAAADERPWLGELQAVHQRYVDDLTDDRLINQRLARVLRTGDGGSRLPKVKLVFRGRHLTANYALNRFLALLISTYVDKQGDPGWKTLCPGSHIADVTASDPTSHPCLEPSPVPGRPVRAAGRYSPEQVLEAHACRGFDHRVEIAGATTETFVANTIIIRHGSLGMPGRPEAAEAGVRRPKALSRPKHLWLYHVAR